MRMFDKPLDTGNEKHIKRSDILGIFISLGLGVFTILTGSGLFGGYYLFAGFFRFFLIALQWMRVRKKDSFEKKFKKERRLCRFAGIILILVNFSCTALFLATSLRNPSDLFKKHTWLIFIYVAYALYKFVSAFVLLQKSRRSWSPYREIFSSLSFFECLITIISVESLVFGVFDFFSDSMEVTLASVSVLVITIVTLVLGVKMVKSRPLPNLIRSSMN